MTPWRELGHHACSNSWRTMFQSWALLDGNVLRQPLSSCSRPQHLINCLTSLYGWRSTAAAQTWRKVWANDFRLYLNPLISVIAETNGQAILPAPLSEQARSNSLPSLAERRRIFKQIIVKCVLQLLLIETTNDLLRNENVYNTIPPEQLLKLMGVLDHSYQFARLFNEDKDLRTGLWKVGEFISVHDNLFTWQCLVGFMKHLPNLLKQESSSASTLVHVLLRMYYDPRPAHQTARAQIADRFLPWVVYRRFFLPYWDSSIQAQLRRYWGLQQT